jgi:DNA polymerase I-like protein with 3'-5' exonuclease and polymerase domains
LRSRRKIKLWADELGPVPPFDISSDSLFIVYNAVAEMSFFLAMGWPLPERVLDLFIEEKRKRNGYSNPKGTFELLSVLNRYGVPHIPSYLKEIYQERAGVGFPFSDQEKRILKDYCMSDSDETACLAGKMWQGIDFPRAILRGRYMKAVAVMEFNGIPIDVPLYNRLGNHWDPIKLRLVQQINKQYGEPYEGLTFKRIKFETWLGHRGLIWPRLDSGEIRLDDKTFEMMSRVYPEISDLRKVRQMLGNMHLNKLELGADGYNRSPLFPFASKTGRNQPKNNKFIFGPGSWMRGFIKPEEGWGCAYLDWRAQESGIAAALSGDPNMQKAYLTGDFYLAFAKMAGAIPEDATKKSHPIERNLYKICALAVQYGMEFVSLSKDIKQPPIVARELLQQHRSLFRQYWRWSDDKTDSTNLSGCQETIFGWLNHVSTEFKDRSARNFPMQANGAEMLRLACCLAVEAGIIVLAPVHDAILIMARLEVLDQTTAHMREIMEEASRIVLGGFTICADCDENAIARYPDRYMDSKDGSKVFWDRIMTLLEEVEDENKEESQRLVLA